MDHRSVVASIRTCGHLRRRLGGVRAANELRTFASVARVFFLRVCVLLDALGFSRPDWARSLARDFAYLRRRLVLTYSSRYQRGGCHHFPLLLHLATPPAAAAEVFFTGWKYLWRLSAPEWAPAK